MKTREVICRDLDCWFIYYKNHIDATGTQDKILVLSTIKFKDYKKFKDDYPMIYLGDNLITKYSELTPEYNFMPTVEYSTELDCYIKCEDNDEIDMIVSSHWLSYSVNIDEYKPTRNIKSKTYLMIDGNGYYKIGKSFNPKARESVLQSENPTIGLVAICEKDIESDLHLEYNEYRKRGEWFRLSKKQVKNIIKQNDFQYE